MYLTRNTISNVLRSSWGEGICIPIISMTIFGLLANRNVQQIAYRTVPLVRRELDKQLIAMILVQVFYDVTTMLPIIIQNIYTFSVGTPGDSFALVQFKFIRNLTTICFYFYFVVCKRLLKNNVLFFIYRVHFTSIYVFQNDFISS